MTRLWLKAVGSLALAFGAGTLHAQTAGASRWMDAGGQALRQGNAAEAEADFQRALAENPQSADAYLGIGMAQLRQGKPDAAEQSLAKASELKPSLPSAHLFRGIALFQTGSAAEAIGDLQAELQLQPGSAEVLTWLGIVELSVGKPDDAATALDRAGALRPNDQSLLYYRVRAHTLAAKEAFVRLSEIDANSAYVHRAQAEIYAESQQPDKAVEEYGAALKRSPKDPELYEAMGEELQKIGRTADAVTAYRSELAINPSSSVALYNLGKIQVETGDPGEGVTLLRRAVEAHAVAAPAYFYLGFGLAKLGSDEEAASCLERSLASGPSAMLRQRGDYELARVYRRLGRKSDSERVLEELKKLKSAEAPAEARK